MDDMYHKHTSNSAKIQQKLIQKLKKFISDNQHISILI